MLPFGLLLRSGSRHEAQRRETAAPRLVSKVALSAEESSRRSLRGGFLDRFGAGIAEA